jgi:hypothetical protein
VAEFATHYRNYPGSKEWKEASMFAVKSTELNAVYRRLLKMTLEELQLLEQQIGQLDQD